MAAGCACSSACCLVRVQALGFRADKRQQSDPPIRSDSRLEDLGLKVGCTYEGARGTAERLRWVQ